MAAGGCYEEVIEQLAHRALQAAARSPSRGSSGASSSGSESSGLYLSSGKYLIGIAGGPGSGKTTLSGAVRDAINALQPGAAQVVPMDGFHLYKRQLDQMPDPQVGCLVHRGCVCSRSAPSPLPSPHPPMHCTGARARTLTHIHTHAHACMHIR